MTDSRGPYQRDVAGVDEAGREHRQRRLAADGVVHLRGRIERHAERPLHEAGNRLLEAGIAVVHVAAVLGLVDLLGHSPTDRLGGHRVVLADPEIDQRPARSVGQGLPLGPLDLLELVDLGPFAVVRSANPLGKQGLKVPDQTSLMMHRSKGQMSRIGKSDFMRCRGRLGQASGLEA
jgi:hypothetical protein